MEEDALLTPSEAASRLGVKKGTVSRWIRDEALDAIPLPGADYRIRESTIARMITIADRTGQAITDEKPASNWMSILKALKNAS